MLSLRTIVLLPLLCSVVLADRVVTEDGRVLEAKKAREKDGTYTLEFEHGTIVVPKDRFVKAVEIEGDMSDYVPANDDERDKLAQGFVRYHGKWIHKTEYEGLLRRENERSSAEADAAAAHSEWHNALQKETKHFLVFSNTSQELLDYYSDLLEAYWALMDDRIGIDPTPIMRRTKMTVNVYKSAGDFHSLSGESDPAVLGFFTPDGQSLNFFHDYGEPEKSQWVALHECTHLLTYLIDQQFRPQIWINEAIADYFGSSEVERDKSGKLHIVPGKLQTDRVLTVQQAIQSGNAITLDKLFFLPAESFRGFEYAHAWSFVYFLNNAENGKYAKGFAKFFKDLYTTAKGVPFTSEASYGQSGTGKVVKPEDIRDLLLKKIGAKDVEALGKAWHAYIAGIEIDAPRARLKRGLNAILQLRYQEALADLDAAIEGGVEDARAHWGRARALALLGLPNIEVLPKEKTTVDFRPRTPEEARKEALADMTRAVELQPLEGRYRHELSLLMVGRAAFVNYGDQKQKFDNKEAEAQAGLATELDPENEEYRQWLAAFQ
jgi:hypothetical protein